MEMTKKKVMKVIATGIVIGFPTGQEIGTRSVIFQAYSRARKGWEFIEISGRLFI